MSDEVKKPSTDTEMRDLIENLYSQEPAEFLEDAGLRGELRDLLNYEMGYGDDEDIREKAKRALRIGIRQIEQGKASSEFLAYIVIGIHKTLSGVRKA